MIALYPLVTPCGTYHLRRRTGDWHACLAGHPEVWGCGPTPEVAVRECAKTADTIEPLR